LENYIFLLIRRRRRRFILILPRKLNQGA